MISGAVDAFALLHRPGTDPDRLELLTGPVETPGKLADIPLPVAPRPGSAGHDVLVVMPYRQIAERGFDHVDDGAPLLAMPVTEQSWISLAEAFARIPDTPIALTDAGFDIGDEEYAQVVDRIRKNEINRGEGANFVIKRSYVADIPGYSTDRALTLFRRLLAHETGAHWTFLVHTGDRTFVGSTPERHVSMRGARAVMNPVSGTYRYPPTGPSVRGAMEFLSDDKETDELYMVVDEELKMMARICDRDIALSGPHLKEMSRLAHTEYLISGTCRLDPREVLRETMFAPTVTGSPLESACSVISRYEPGGRGYYSGALALVGHDEDGAPTLDSGILIRTADIDAAGRMRIGVGATLVRHSVPASEVLETRSKAAALLSALGGEQTRRQLSDDPGVRRALARRNEGISRFWLEGGDRSRGPALATTSVLVVDGEDTFTAMLAHQLRSLRLTVDIRRFDEPYDTAAYDLVVMGPGPGDPCDPGHPKIMRMRGALRRLLAERRRFLAVCLSHQLLSLELGLPVGPRDVPNQGLRKPIDLFGHSEHVGFYNSFAARAGDPELVLPGLGRVEISRDATTGEVHALRGPGFVSMQFHPESVLTENGVGILERALHEALSADLPPGIAQPRNDTPTEVSAL
ncbi:anthranilate synthase family protein [Streptomyces sp. NPDC006645]|uniref:anthranilate synthase family protein n=1 Tax=unclassified Streptomyces TaxID=2593676 RepID=UPI0033AE1724